MRLKELQIFGFKSFPNKTTIKFSQGITAIIGPNGCGKTNILDALRWVLGEQSFSVLRCNKNEELIFAGTEKYPPLGYTEVKLILENDGDLPNFSSEIEIKRKYFRSGESEYYINRNPCRLKDIQDIFFHAGASSKTYSIFDLKQMREIITGGVKKMFEEAAQLARYRERKNETLNKLALTEQELLRLNDIIAERERYTRSLKRQARRLDIYERLKAEEKKIKLVALATRYRNLKKIEVEQEQLLKVAQAQEETALNRLAQLEDELAKIRQQLKVARQEKETLANSLETKRKTLVEQEKTLIAKQERINYLQQQIAGYKQESEILRKVIEKRKEQIEYLTEQVKEKELAHSIIQQQLEDLRGAIRKEEEVLFQEQLNYEQAKTHFQTISEKLSTLHQKKISETAQYQNHLEAQNRLNKEIENLVARINTLQETIGQNEKKVTEIDECLAKMKLATNEKNTSQIKLTDELKTLIEQKQQRQETLSLLKQEIQLLKTDLGQESQNRLKNKLGDNYLGMVQEFFKVKDGYERAVEAALYSILDFIVVKKGIMPNEFQSETRCGFILPSPFPIPHSLSSIPPGCFGQLKDFVELKSNAPQLLLTLFNEFILVDDFPTALKLSEEYPQFSFVTQDGIALFKQGIVLVEGQIKGKLTLERILSEKLAEKLRIEEEIASLGKQITEQEFLIAKVGQELEEIQSERLKLLSERSKLKALDALMKKSSEEMKKELTWLQNDLSQVQNNLHEDEQRIVRTKEELKELLTVENSTKISIERIEKAVAEKQKQIKEKLEEASRILSNLSKKKEELTTQRTELAYQTKELVAAQQRLNELSEMVKKQKATVEELTREIQTIKQAIEENQEVINTECEMRNIECGTRIENLVKDEERLENALKAERSALETFRAQLMEQRMRQFELQKQCEAIEQEEPAIATVEIFAEEGIEEKLKMISERLMTLGKVNPLAKEEYQKEKSELDKYQSQRQDVLQARDNLQKTIIEIENYAKDQLLETFRLVRERFRSIFTQLFVEGEADLVLQDKSNPLDSEIEIIARPKGKMPKRLEHLSDGEKALLALSLLFAFYSVKPAPFCFFDEVDAPLDDANVERFANFLRELTRAGIQGVVITHNRLTIEKADVLLGVTTEEPGVSKIISVRLADFKPEKARDEVRF